MALGSTQPLREMSTRNISWAKGGRCVGLTILTPLYADCLGIWKPQSPGNLRACRRDKLLKALSTKIGESCFSALSPPTAAVRGSSAVIINNLVSKYSDRRFLFKKKLVLHG